MQNITGVSLFGRSDDDGVTVKPLERTGGCSSTSLFSKMTRVTTRVLRHSHVKLTQKSACIVYFQRIQYKLDQASDEGYPKKKI